MLGHYAHAMIKRPRSVTVTSWIFIAFGSIALLMSLLPPVDAAASQRIAEFRSQHPYQFALLYVGPILAVVCGVFMLRGCNWARWLLVVWFGHNVIGNVLHSPLKLLLPGLLFAVAVYYLFRPQATAYFRATGGQPPQIPKSDETPVA
jgi:hypothetical protein